MLRKLPRSFHGAKRGNAKRASRRGGGCRIADPSDTGSDPIQSSDAGEVHSLAMPNRSTGCGLEVVLPCQLHGDRSLPPSIPGVGSS
ncbi:hypothetical protein A2U01_0079950, partial [Trifolium medium]|nr:hypothetical protein [Trifolium medium]